jgi:hypothetical protein
MLGNLVLSKTLYWEIRKRFDSQPFLSYRSPYMPPVRIHLRVIQKLMHYIIDFFFIAFF